MPENQSATARPMQVHVAAPQDVTAVWDDRANVLRIVSAQTGEPIETFDNVGRGLMEAASEPGTVILRPTRRLPNLVELVDALARSGAVRLIERRVESERVPLHPGTTMRVGRTASVVARVLLDPVER